MAIQFRVTVAAQHVNWKAVAMVTLMLVNNATTGKVTSPGTNSPNRLLFTNY